MGNPCGSVPKPPLPPNPADYVLATVFLALVLFFIGISSRLEWLPARLAMIAAGAAILVFTTWQLVGYPIV